MGRHQRIALAILPLVLSCAGATAHDIDPNAAGVGVDEKLGSSVPLEARFMDENGTARRLGDMITTPTILALEYYRCRNSCGLLMTGIAQVVAQLPGAGRDYKVITVSINERETAADALEAKRLAMEEIGSPFPEDGWRFLTADAGSIDALADAVGYRFIRVGPDDFDHPLGLVIVSPKGMIVRYITGTDFLPVDLKMSFLEASQGRIEPTIAKFLRFCFSYDSQNHQFVFNTLKVSAIFVFLIAGGFAAYLIVSGQRKRRERGGHGVR
jgi:protein SCO1/2